MAGSEGCVGQRSWHVQLQHSGVTMCLSRAEMADCDSSRPLIEGPRYICLASGLMVAVTQKSVPLALGLHTAWGPVEVKPQVFVIMGDNDDILILGRATLGIPGIYPIAMVDRIAKEKRGESSVPC